MTHANSKPAWQTALIVLAATVVTCTLLAILVWARIIVIPIVMAVFLAFVLAPVVRGLQKWSLPRIPAVLTAVALASLAFLAVAWMVGMQLAELTQSLPEREPVIRAKLERVRHRLDAIGENFRLREFQHAAEQISGGPESAEPVKAVVVDPWSGRVQAVAGPLAEFAAQAAFALVLVVFMLVRREDLRDRFLRLVGHHHMTRTTKALDEAARRA